MLSDRSSPSGLSETCWTPQMAARPRACVLSERRRRTPWVLVVHLRCLGVPRLVDDEHTVSPPGVEGDKLVRVEFVDGEREIGNSEGQSLC